HGSGEGHEHHHEHGCGCGGGGGGGHGWLDMLADCQAAVTLGIGGGALEGLRRRGVQPVVLAQPMEVDEALALFKEGKLP
ncbi:MAG: hypothetical protein KC933_17275, partial [Myxococcales bacterium]|nr:hypothetical protein [Myxococcales bacterium]